MLVRAYGYCVWRQSVCNGAYVDDLAIFLKSVEECVFEVIDRDLLVQVVDVDRVVRRALLLMHLYTLALYTYLSRPSPTRTSLIFIPLVEIT